LYQAVGTGGSYREFGEVGARTRDALGWTGMQQASRRAKLISTMLAEAEMFTVAPCCPRDGTGGAVSNAGLWRSAGKQREQTGEQRRRRAGRRERKTRIALRVATVVICDRPSSRSSRSLPSNSIRSMNVARLGCWAGGHKLDAVSAC
jgi:hypothetical protein